MLLIAVLSSTGVFAQTAGGIFEQGPEMQSTRIAITMGSTSSGEIILFGGRAEGFISSPYADIFDPETQTFTNVNMLYPHDNAIVIRTSDDLFFVAGGGYDWGVPAYANVEWFDPETRLFTDGGNLLYPRMQGNGTELTSGKLLIVGGWYDPAAAANAELYDPATQISTAAGSLVNPRSSAMVLPCNDGGAVVLGGYPTYGGNCYPGAEYYDPNTNSFSTLYAELVPLMPGYTTAFDNANKEVSSLYRMPDGKYVFLVWRKDPVMEYGIMTFDPETKQFSLIPLDATLMGDYTDAGILELCLNQEEGLAYVLGLDAESSLMGMALVTVDLQTGKVYAPDMVYNMPDGKYMIYGNMVYIPSMGKILYAGISTSAADYFHATTGTYLITPDYTVDVPMPEIEPICQVYPNPSQGIVEVYMEVAQPSSFIFTITDISGRSMCDEIRHAAVEGAFRWRLDMQDFPAGSYNLLISSEHMQLTKRIVIVD